MASSELSLILNNANANLYPSEPQPNLLSMTAPMGRLSEMTFSSNNNSTMGPWDLVNPQMWTGQNVLEWIGFHVEESRFDASLLNMNYCDMDGITLCTMSKETLMSMFGSTLGEQLHHSLETLKARYATDLSETCLSESELDLLDNILQNSFPYMHGPSLGPLLETVVVQPSIPSDNSENSYSYFDECTNQLTPESDHGYDSLTESFQSSHTGSFLNPSSPESNSSDSDPEYSEMHYSTSTKNFVKQESVETKKRGRGRPPKPRDSEGYEHFIQPKKSKHAPRGTHLWEFIRDILIHPEQNQGLMKWEDRRGGIFKFLKSEAVAQLWGQADSSTSSGRTPPVGEWRRPDIEVDLSVKPRDFVLLQMRNFRLL
ncbi:ETS-related transcription factor Elf-3-like isoform X2 [Sinocyclocheilus anshuiensis]|uniref:ETS-related transcription factor Elf-3-like isoform X1 n=1 Tax=Sinocyclocheilus anshuiensis TaxID=1608454 RepID=UPI0007BA5687|nr:PREDICTED: ETS-related transcription factor Elf-3-like isoform X1 [Sinocyclocheilus anshuiensis]XP_016354754.1 PREDICTED: ETS-related transcription factor Elf-3-like isoform X2 [Sinocyclocheilus anshuiensis]